MVRKRSDIWLYFEKLSFAAKCKNCGTIVKTGGNTSNLWNHLERNHREIFFELKGASVKKESVSKKKSSLSMPQLEEQDMLAQLSEESHDENVTEKPVFEEVIEEHLFLPPQNGNIVTSPHPEEISTPARKKTKKSDTKKLKMEMSSSVPYAVLQSPIQGPPKPKNVIDIYGELVIAKLRAMDEQSREIAMHRIDNVLFEIRMNNVASKTNDTNVPPAQIDPLNEQTA